MGITEKEDTDREKGSDGSTGVLFSQGTSKNKNIMENNERNKIKC